MTQQDPRVAPVAHAGRHPLRRRIDDVEARILTGLLLVFFLAAPALCVFAGRLTDAASVREQYAERLWRPVTAQLDQSAASGLIGLDGDWGASFVQASWTAPDGRPAGGLLAVSLNARAGQRISVWVTGTGRLTRPRLSSAEVKDRVSSAVLATAGAVALVLAIVAGAVRIITGRRRMAGWARAWAVVAPHWSSGH